MIFKSRFNLFHECETKIIFVMYLPGVLLFSDTICYLHQLVKVGN